VSISANRRAAARELARCNTWELSHQNDGAARLADYRA